MSRTRWNDQPVSAARRTFQYGVEAQPSLQGFLEVEAIHADGALAFAECNQAVLGKSAVADKEAARPRGFLVELAVEGVELARAARRPLPFGFLQIRVGSEEEAAVYLSPCSRKASRACSS